MGNTISERGVLPCPVTCEGRAQTPSLFWCAQHLPEVDQLPQLEVPYPIKNRGQHLRRASGSCPVPIRYIH